MENIQAELQEVHVEVEQTELEQVEAPEGNQVEVDTPEAPDKEEDSSGELELEELRKDLEARETELWSKQVLMELKESNLLDFAPLVTVDVNDVKGLQAQIKQIIEILGQRQLNSSFVPSNHASTDKYSKAQANNDVTGMLNAKLGRLFK